MIVPIVRYYHNVPPKLVSDAKLVDGLLAMFRRNGFEGTSLSDLRDATGLGRSSLYHRFPNGKQDMAVAALEETIRHFSEVVFSARNYECSVATRVESIAQALSLFYDEGRLPCLLETLSVGSPPERIVDLTRHAIQAWIDTFTALAAEAGACQVTAAERATDAVASIEGSLVIARTTGSTEAFNRAIATLPARLLR